jgi:transketolase
MAYYAVLAAKGFIPPEALGRFGSFRSPLGFHPDRLRIPGVEISSGSLGHGLPLAVGTAMGLRIRAGDDRPPAVWVLVGDGEFDEGSNHEAMAFAGRSGLANLHVVVIDNMSASLGWPGGLEHRFGVEGWQTLRVDGRDHGQLYDAFTSPHPGRPLVVAAEVTSAEA